MTARVRKKMLEDVPTIQQHPYHKVGLGEIVSRVVGYINVLGDIQLALNYPHSFGTYIQQQGIRVVLF